MLTCPNVILYYIQKLYVNYDNLNKNLTIWFPIFMTVSQKSSILKTFISTLKACTCFAIKCIFKQYFNIFYWLTICFIVSINTHNNRQRMKCCILSLYFAQMFYTYYQTIVSELLVAFYMTILVYQTLIFSVP